MAISIDSSNYFSLPQTAEDDAAQKANALKSSIQGLDVENASDKELMDVCKEFEAYFVEQIFKEMKKTVKSPEDEGEYMQYFGDMLTQEYAKSATEGEGLGLAKMLYESMKRR